MDYPTKTRDKKLCRSIATSLGDIVRYSMDDNFRNSCFDLFNVESTKEMQEKIGETLNDFCNTNFYDCTPKKQTANKQESTPKQENHPQLLELTPKRETLEPTRQLMGGGSRNWLNVAAQQTRSTILRQSLGSQNKQKLLGSELKCPTMAKSFKYSNKPTATTPLNYNQSSTLSNPNYFTFNSPDCSSTVASPNGCLEKTRKMLFFENDDD